ncbi:acyl-CoA thioester hydrolase/BAAT C-terminal domain-containing protein [uncultured Kordia sp.]|uniref:acyl-CoA thioester hydrolase/BAAT C-terminal domain-containing protein n=1 Tax=uncultured Kordia sp. TaxID=507699 RepID=UPI00261A2E8C|nr:acyl-CoA thioester hydrolase/BAAT C-terminal domain-containing protein [uncultured Kordia sp.]
MKNSKKYSFIIGIIAVFIFGYFIADHFLYNGVKAKAIHKNGFQGNYYAKNDTQSQPTVILIGGGQWGDYWAEQISKKGYASLSLPYTRREGLPKLAEEINLEYFEKAFKWLSKQSAVNSDKIVVMGASRNAELALVLATTFPEYIHGVVAYAPSAVSWSNTVLPYSANTIKPSWKYKGIAIPYVPMNKIQGNNTAKIQTLPYWENGLTKTNKVAKAIIKIENSKGPILLFSGLDDQVWPAATMADMLAERIKTANFKYDFKNIQYDNAGHLISTHPDINSSITTGNMTIDGKTYEFEFGGTIEGDTKAKKDARDQLFLFLEKLK